VSGWYGGEGARTSSCLLRLRSSAWALTLPGRALCDGSRARFSPQTWGRACVESLFLFERERSEASGAAPGDWMLFGAVKQLLCGRIALGGQMRLLRGGVKQALCG